MPNSIQSTEDFYEVLPIIKSELTLDAKVARIKKIFDKAVEEGKEETLAKIGSDYDKHLISKAREETIYEIERWGKSRMKNYESSELRGKIEQMKSKPSLPQTPPTTQEA